MVQLLVLSGTNVPLPSKSVLLLPHPGVVHFPPIDPNVLLPLVLLYKWLLMEASCLGIFLFLTKQWFSWKILGLTVPGSDSLSLVGRKTPVCVHSRWRFNITWQCSGLSSDYNNFRKCRQNQFISQVFGFALSLSSGIGCKVIDL